MQVVHTWGLHLKGPLYISIFMPLSIGIAAAMGVIFLGDALYLGRYRTLSHVCVQLSFAISDLCISILKFTCLLFYLYVAVLLEQY